MDETPLIEPLPEGDKTPVTNHGLICRTCGVENTFTSKFCSACGAALKVKYSQQFNTQNNDAVVGQIIAFFVALVLIISLYGYTELFNPTFESSLLVDGIMAAVVLVFASLNYKSILKLYSLKNVHPAMVLLLIIIMMLTALGVHFLADFINTTFFDDDGGSMLWVYQQTQWPVLLSILFIGVYPAIFEEIAFRGFLFNNLLLFSKPRSVIFTSGFLFAFIHFSIIGLLWLVPLGLFFGYLRFRYRNLWYSSICHFVYNTTIVVLSFSGV